MLEELQQQHQQQLQWFGLKNSKQLDLTFVRSIVHSGFWWTSSTTLFTSQLILVQVWSFFWCIFKIHAYILLVCLSENRTVSFKEANNFSWLEGLILAIFQFAYEEKIFFFASFQLVFFWFQDFSVKLFANMLRVLYLTLIDRTEISFQFIS